MIKHGFTGRAISKYRESYTPRLYLTCAYDVLGGVTKDFEFWHRPDEITDACNMVMNFEPNSLTLYDRLYISARLTCAHQKSKSKFLFRCRRQGVDKNIISFWNGKKRMAKITLAGDGIWLIKIHNPKSHKDDVFATNLLEVFVSKKKIRGLYNLRWEVENSFRELSETLNIQQRGENGITAIK